MSAIELNDDFKLAESYLNTTNEHLFVTGNAGTGKTSFLKYIKSNCPKNIVISASTGIASINAEGVTLHSLFQLPFAPFIPTTENKELLIKNIRMGKAKLDLIRRMEVLVIDEVSMVRADVLDAIDAILKSARRKYDEAFGGLQVLFIGDLNQLPPVVKSDEWQVLSPYYNSPYFFDSEAILSHPPIVIQFKKVYRQQNQAFIDLLNHIRNNRISIEVLDGLNKRYVPNFQPPTDTNFITLTSHNIHADNVNKSRLNELSGQDSTYIADIKDDFPEYLFPNDKDLALKVGAQVMFIKNDSTSHRYYNGKIGVIHQMHPHKVEVKCDDQVIEVYPDKWENVKYSLDSATNSIVQQIVGTYTQLPLRLAWAITIHKSQGLTFDNVMIDAAQSFTSGQVYVALSRCRSLEGIVLLSKIGKDAIHYDSRIESNVQSLTNRKDAAIFLHTATYNYFLYVVQRLLSFEKEIEWSAIALNVTKRNKDKYSAESIPFWESIRQEFLTHKTIVDKFLKTLHSMVDEKIPVETNKDMLQRVSDAIRYFLPIVQKLEIALEQNPIITESKEAASGINLLLNDIYNSIRLKKHCLSHCAGNFSVFEYHKANTSYKSSFPKLSTYNKTDSADYMGDDVLLLERLLSWRKSQVDVLKIPIYLIGNTEMFRTIAEQKPVSFIQLQQIKGMGQAKVAKYGKDILDIVREYCEEFDIQQNEEIDFEEDVQKLIKKSNKTTRQVSESVVAKPKKPLHYSQYTTLDLWNQYRNIEKVAELRGLTKGTIESHIAFLSKEGKIKYEEWIDPRMIHQITAVVLQHADKNLTELKLLLPEEITFTQIRGVKDLIELKNVKSTEDEY
jgi:hypothetical protein